MKSKLELLEQERYLQFVENVTCQGHCERQETYARPDILILGKALSGGAFPVSAVLADDHIMNVITTRTAWKYFWRESSCCCSSHCCS